ncbi:MAG: hypothetical protein GX159_11745 [Flavobacteriaceae bacterium]|jgi:hypothetical protein|nr:hypothetical protein [Flavobacteriaceae bacterium]
MRLLYTIFLGFLIVGCSAQKEHTVTFINQSDTTIDSITIGVASADVYAVKHTNIEPSDTVVSAIPRNKPKSNKHDITIFITIFIKDQDVIYKYSYNDLIGYLNHDYTIILNKEKEVEWQYPSSNY